MVPVAVVMTPSYGPGETTHAFDSLRRSGLHPKAHVANDDAGAVSDKVFGVEILAGPALLVLQTAPLGADRSGRGALQQPQRTTRDSRAALVQVARALPNRTVNSQLHYAIRASPAHVAVSILGQLAKQAAPNGAYLCDRGR